MTEKEAPHPSRAAYRRPVTAEGWLEVARERASDARALKQRPGSAGPVYMAGYAIECSLKAYLQSRGIRFPTRGAVGHDLRGLWAKAGFRLTDLKDAHGAKTFYIERWSTDLRYVVSADLHLSVDQLLAAARELTRWIQARTRRGRRSR